MTALRNELLERIDSFIQRAFETCNSELHTSEVFKLLKARIASLRLLRRAVQLEPHETIPSSFEEALVVILNDGQPML
jgi:hypothetical protein